MDSTCFWVKHCRSQEKEATDAKQNIAEQGNKIAEQGDTIAEQAKEIADLKRICLL